MEMTVIRSRANPLFKRLRLLAGSAQRQRREGLAMLEGAHLAQAYLTSRPALSDVACCLVAESVVPSLVTQLAADLPGRLADPVPNPVPDPAATGSALPAAIAVSEIADLVAQISRVNPRLVAVMEDALFDQISPVGNGGVGLMLLVKVPQALLPERIEHD